MPSPRAYTAAPEASLREAQPALAPASRAEGFAPSLAWPVLLASLAMVALLMARTGLTVTLWTASNVPYLIAAALVLALRAGWLGNRPHSAALRDCAGYYAVLTCMALAGAVASYPIAALTQGSIDPVLARSDAALGFDWTALYQFVAAHPLLQHLGSAAYESIYVTPAVLLGWFALTGQRREAHRFLASFWLAAVITLALFCVMPAMGPFAFLWHGPIRYMPVSELWQTDIIPALRAHTFHSIELNKLRGLVSAPSFHAAAGVLYLRTAWRAGAVRWPMAWLAGAMLLATPVEGTHYLTDMLIGAGVAVLAMAAVDAVLARQASVLRALAPA